MALCLARNCHFASWAHIFISLLDGLVSLMCCDWHERGSFQSSVITTVWSINITLFYVTFFDGVCLCVCLRVWCSSVYFSTYLLTTSSLQFQSRYAAHTQKLAVHNWQIFANKSLFEIGHSANKWNSNILTMSQYVRCTCRAKTHTHNNSNNDNSHVPMNCFIQCTQRDWRFGPFINLTNGTLIRIFNVRLQMDSFYKLMLKN